MRSVSAKIALLLGLLVVSISTHPLKARKEKKTSKIFLSPIISPIIFTGNEFPITGNGTIVSVPTSVAINICGNNVTFLGPMPDLLGNACVSTSTSSSSASSGQNNSQSASSASAAQSENNSGNLTASGSGASSASASNGGGQASAGAGSGSGSSASTGGIKSRDGGIRLFDRDDENQWYHFEAPADAHVQVCGHLVRPYAVKEKTEYECDDEHDGVYVW